MNKRILHLFRKMLAIAIIFALAFGAVQGTQGTTAQAAKKVVLIRPKSMLIIGDTMQLTLKNLPKAKKVQWSTSNKKIATVSAKGKVKGKKTGMVKITAKVGKKKYTCYLKVKGKPIIPTPPTEDSLNASEVAALKKLIAEQRELGNDMCEDVTDMEDYTWNNEGSLVTLAHQLFGKVSLQGFPSLTGIYAGIFLDDEEGDDGYRGKLTGLDVSKNPALETLSCSNNQVTELDVTNNPALVSLNCHGNQLTELDVTKNPALTVLSCGTNQLAELDVTNNPKLTDLYCKNNQLTEIDVTKNPDLETLNCEENKLTELDITKNPTLTYFSCRSNGLAELDVTKNPLLWSLHCDNNRLTGLNVTKNPKLRYLFCSHNELTTLDVTKNPALAYFSCGNNQLTALDVRNNPDLAELYCDNNRLTALNVKKNPSLEILDCEGNQLTKLNVAKNPKLETLKCDDTVSVTK